MSVSPSFLNQVFILKSVSVSGGSLLLYDYSITLSSEVEYIWRAPWSIVKVGFLVNRYGNLIGQSVVTLHHNGLFGPSSPEMCRAFCLFYMLFMFFSSESARCVVTVRAWAVWGCSYRATLWLILLYALYLFAVIGVTSYFWKHGGALPSPSVDGICLSEVPPFSCLEAYAWFVWLVALGVDSIALVMVCGSLRKSLSGFRSTSPLIRLLVRDSISFYAAGMLNNGLSIICWTVFRRDPRAFLQLVFSLPVLSIAGQRLVLNLRRLRARPYTSSYVSQVVDRELVAMRRIDEDEDAW